MARQFKRLGFFVFVFVFCFFFNSAAFAVDTFSVTLMPPALEVVMKDSNAVIPVTIANSATSLGSIQSVSITVPPLKYTLSNGTTAPAGWCVSRINAATGNVQYTIIDPATGKCRAPKTATVPPVGIAPGASLTFNLMATPLSAVADFVNLDALTTVTVKTPKTFTQTGVLPSPVWTRRSLDAVFSAVPSSTSVGGEITVDMQVSNKSTAPQMAIATTPAPPTAAPAIAVLSAGPFYASTTASAAITATSTAITVGSTTGFAPSPSSIQIDSEKIWYTGMTGTSFTGVTRGYGATAPSAHSAGSLVYRLSPFDLTASGTAGDSGTITWKYTAKSAGTINFTARASDSTVTTKSLNKVSNSVTVNDFTSVIGVAPDTAVNNQIVTISMTVNNNGPTALINVAPSALTAGAGCLATNTIVSGPSPASISSIAPGGAGVFTWTYTVAGTAAQSYCISGNATADGPVLSAVTTSNSGVISNVSASVSPASVSSGAATALAPQTFIWTITNMGTCSISRVDITVPVQATCPTTGWCFATAPAGGYLATAPAGWTGTLRKGPPDTVRFSGATPLAAGASAVFPLTFTSTQTVTADTLVSFPVILREMKTKLPLCAGLTDYAGSTKVTVTANSMTIAVTPVAPPAVLVPADGSSYYTISATLKNGATPLSGKTVSFSNTNGSLSSPTAVTDANGMATVKLIAPYSTVAATATVTASYMNAAVTTPVLSFSGFVNANLAYWGGLAPNCGVPGSPASYSLNVKNISATTAMSLTSNSFFAYNDGVHTYCAYLDSASQGAISPNAVKKLTFGSSTSAGGGGATLPAAFVAGKYMPMSSATPCAGLASGLYLYESAASVNNQYRNVPDFVTVGGICAATGNTGNILNVIDWHEIK